MNKISIPKYEGIKLIKCPICQCLTEHTLFDYEYTIYKCTKCNNIHARTN